MRFENLIINKLNLSQEAKDLNEELEISNCVITNCMMAGGYFRRKVTIENSLIFDLVAIGRYFDEGLKISSCVFVNGVSFEGTGCKNPQGDIIIENSIFQGFLDFFDAHYEGRLIFNNNILLQGTNILGNQELPIESIFKNGIEHKLNIGKLDISDPYEKP